MTRDDPYRLKRPFARLDWAEAGPVARDAGDVYFSAQNGLEESRAVFLAGAGFPARFDAARTIVGELGFGTGLNFLALWDSFRRNAPSGSRLHFVTVEGFPLSRGDVGRALAAFPELAGLSQALLDAWPSPHKGAHRRVFEDGRVTLTVFHDEAEAALAQMDFQADAWFLDGFAPSKNPQMWTPSLFRHLARLSKPGAPAATFTVAGAVRRGLAEAGFDVEKRPGFARKRERLEAIYRGAPVEHKATPLAPVAASEGPVAIIGGGVAAASLVHALTRRGRQVRVFARGGWAAGASSAPYALLTPRLEAADRPHARAMLNAFDYAADLYRRLGVFEPTGVLRLASDREGARRLERLAGLLDDRFEAVDEAHASRRAGVASAAGLWMGPAGGLHPRDVVAALAGPTPAHDLEITGLQADVDGWRLESACGRREGPFGAVVIAGGHEAGALSGLAIEATAGRVGVFEREGRLHAPVAWGGYAAPLSESRMLVGATHVKGADPGAREDAAPQLRQAAADAPLEIGEALGADIESWGGVRAAVADRLPLAGAVPDAGFEARWRPAARGGAMAPHGPEREPSPLMLGALGARGFAHAPLLAEQIASALCGEPPALERAALDALHPARFAWRALKRGA